LKVLFTARAWAHYLHWAQSDALILARLNTLIEAVRRDPFKGIGKPEPLKHELKGLWSRRIDQEHRLVYRVSGPASDQIVELVQCRYHYSTRRP
jgi:toxin YoeB